ncbi:MAG: PQQ-dependent sugar dehydrogenase [Clostridia bacterium]
MRRLVLGLVVALCPALTAAQVLESEEQAFRVVKVVEGLDHPWCVAWLPDGRVLITERRGTLRVVKDGKLEAKPVEGLPEVVQRAQSGLFDVAPHPNFKENGLVYLAYTASGEGGIGTELARGKLVGNRLENVRVIFKEQPKGPARIQFGGRIVFDGKGHVFLTLGDLGDKDRAQRPDDDAGSVIRLNEDGSIPKDNPFVGKPGWKPAKYDLGHRNMQGAALHPQTGMLWTHEHGPQGGDEINVIRPGRNYGWPVITYGVNYGSGTKIGEGTAKPGMEQPLYYWVPSIAPSGMAFYTGDKFPKWKGDLFVGSLKFDLLVRLRLDGEKVVKEERMLKGVLGRIRDVRVGPDGLIYLLTDESAGVLARLEPAN